MKKLLLVFCASVVFLGAAAPAGPFQLVSARDSSQPPPAGGSGDSWAPILSPDGRYVLFASAANNLVPISGTNPLPVSLAPQLNVFLRDRTNGTTTLVSVNLGGTGGGNRDSIPTALSDDGRFALFESGASDLAPGDTNGLTDVFLRDTWSNVTVWISVSTNGGAGNGVCRGSTMTPDGSYVAFVSAANNLAPGDTNGIADVFVRDVQAGVTTLASAGARAINPYSPVGSESPDLSGDGRFVVFYSAATNLVAGATSGGEIYLRDLVAATTTWVSAGAHALLSGPTVCFNHVLSRDSKFVAYEVCTNPPPASFYARGSVLRYSLDSGLTDTVNTNVYVPAANLEDFHNLDITPDGRFVAFVANTNPAGTTCVDLWDAQSGVTTLVSGNLGGLVPANSRCEWPTMDASGRYVAFQSSASGLATNPVAGGYQLYLRDTQAAATLLLTADTNGAGSGISAATAPRLSANGQWAAFESPDSSLVADDRNKDSDVFVRDVVAGATSLISARDAALPSATPNGPSALVGLTSSADGRWVAFTSDADNLVANDTNGFRDVIVRDLFGGTNLLVSVATNGALGDAISSEPAISADGQYVAFSSSADNLVPGDSNRAQDVFVRALPAGPTALVSVNSAGTGPGNSLSETPVISASGRYVLFRSKATNLTPGSFTAGTENLFLRDLQLGASYALTLSGLASAAMTPDGRWVAFADTAGAAAGNMYLWDSQAASRVETNSLGVAISSFAISPDGSHVICLGGAPGVLYLVDRVAHTNGPIGSGYPLGSRIGLRFSADGQFLAYAAARASNGTNQVYLYDFQARSNLLVSTAFASAAEASAASDSPDISADGRWLAYRSFASNLLAAGDSNSVPDLFLYDRLSGATSLLTADHLTGAPGNNRSLAPQFSPDGRTLLFQSWASDLVPLDFNHSGDVLALAFLYVRITLSGAPGLGPTLSWPSRPGESYHVQFKNNLADPGWQDVNGTVTVSGNVASLTDLAPSASERFYRVAAY